jgi:N utilization substance protein A
MSKELITALEQIEREKGISKESLVSAIEAALTSAYKKDFAATQDVLMDLNAKTGEIHVFAQKEVAESVENRHNQISLEEALKLDPKVKLGDLVKQEITPKDFGRLAAQTAKQVVFQKIKEAERESAFQEFADKEGEMMMGVIRRREGATIFVDLGRSEGVMPPKEQVPGERYEMNGHYRVYLASVQQTKRGPELIVSRSHPNLVLRLFELEVPEIFEGRVEIKSIAREPGMRCKVAVSSREEKIDPVGACVGPKGVRIQAIVRELRGERIDIVRWSREAQEFVSNALSPAKISKVQLDEIGKEGQNARLAAKLTNWKIDIQSEGAK